MVNDGFAAKVREVLSDTLSLPAGFLDYLIEWQAVNALPSKPLPVVLGAVVYPTYSASITPNAALGIWQQIIVTNGTAFTINAPTNAPTASQTQELTIEVLNSSGGAMGVITWNAAFVFAGLVWANPANTKKRRVTFRWNGTNWIATSISSADY